jgi:hypothetical protein
MAALSANARWRFLAVTWGPILGAGLGMGALAGAGQLGIGYGLGLLHFWLPAGPALTGGVWASQLTWVAWFAALAVLAGSGGASWVARQMDEPLGLRARIAIAVASGVGGAVVVALTALPARSLAAPAAPEPVADVVLAAGLGLVVGMLVTVAVLSVRLVAVSVTMLIGAVWLLALVSAAPSLDPGADLPDVRLAVLDLPALGDARSTVAVLSAPVLALLVCGAVAGAARSRGFPPLLTAVSSAAAPGLLALTYLIGSPGTSDRAAQVAAYAGSLIALAAGLLVALLVGAVRLPSASDSAEPGDGDAPTGLIPGVPASPALANLPLPPTELPPTELPPTEPPAAEPPPTSPARFISAEPPEWPARTDLSEPPRTSSLFPEFRLPPLDEPSTPPVADPEPSAPAGFATAADLFRSSEPDTAPEATTPTPTSELPAVAPEQPSKRRRLPKLRRKPKPPKKTAEPEDAAPMPEPAPEPEPVEPQPVEPTSPATPAAPESRPAATPARPKRRREVEHVDWISSLADRSEEEEPPEKGRRRLRRDRDLGSPADSVPDLTWAADESADEDRPSLHRPYVSPPPRDS